MTISSFARAGSASRIALAIGGVFALAHVTRGMPWAQVPALLFAALAIVGMFTKSVGPEVLEEDDDEPNEQELWKEFLVDVPTPTNPKGFPMCGLCGNRGVINTVGHVTTPAGMPCGVDGAPCICPNGRAIAASRKAAST